MKGMRCSKSWTIIFASGWRMRNADRITWFSVRSEAYVDQEWNLSIGYEAAMESSPGREKL